MTSHTCGQFPPPPPSPNSKIIGQKQQSNHTGSSTSHQEVIQINKMRQNLKAFVSIRIAAAEIKPLLKIWPVKLRFLLVLYLCSSASMALHDARFILRGRYIT